ncbi:hypothetical protein [Actinoallomurus sp. CA-142502]|uniref:hypothetical protein n=1 Tax=Actinoallomurus sp. CA-142502 TaxID=3239885 RepID=UPI003D93E78D
MLRVVAGSLAGGTLVALVALWWASRRPGSDARERTRRRPPRGVDPGLALLTWTGLRGNARDRAPMVVLADLVHRRVVHAEDDGRGSWRLAYAAREAPLTGYERLVVNTLFGTGGSASTLDPDALRSIAPAVADELRRTARERGWDRPFDRPRRRPEHLGVVPGLLWAGGLTTFFALVGLVHGHFWLFGYRGWGVTALAFWFAAVTVAAVRADVGEERGRPDRRRRARLRRFLRRLRAEAEAARRGDPRAAEFASRHASYLLVAGEHAGGGGRKAARPDDDAEPDQARLIGEFLEDQERIDRFDDHADALVDYLQEVLERRLASQPGHDPAPDTGHDDGQHDHASDSDDHHDGDHGHDW